MSITRHPDDATLMSYAAGALPGALAAVVAAHVAICPRCRDEVAMMELMGGALLTDLRGVAIQGPEPPLPEIERHRQTAVQGSASAEVPAPLVRLVGSDLDAVRFRWVSRGLWLRWIPIGRGGRLHLFKGAPGATVGDHGHLGSELTLVLRGTIADHTGEYGPGDFCDLDEEVAHTQIVGSEGCICVVAHDHPVRWRNPIVRLARPWHGM